LEDFTKQSVSSVLICVHLWEKTTTMKKVFAISCLWLLPAVASAQSSSVVVTPITADYAAAPPTVTFEVTWPDDRDDDHRSKVWVFVDYRRIKDNAYAPGWSRADITVPAASITATAGTVSLEPDNTNGFWLQGTAGAFAATVTVPVTVDLDGGYAPQFGWCGWAIDGPPTAREETGYYSLHGTPPFIIQTHPTDAGSTVSQSTPTYDNCIYGLTDATGAPGEWPPMPAINDFTASANTICAGESVTLEASAINAQRYSFDNGQTWGSSSSTILSPSTTTDYILKATREKGACTVTSATTITVTVNPAPVILSLTSATICYNTGLTLRATMGGGTTSAMTYSGNLGGYSMTLYTDSFNTGNLYQSTTYSVIARNEYGCESALSTGTVTVLPHLQQDSPGHKSVCADESVAFDLAEATGGKGAFTYLWEQTVESPNWNTTWGTAEGENTGATYTTPPLAQSMRYRRIAMNECGTHTSTDAWVSVHPKPEIQTFTASPDAVCAGQSATLTAEVVANEISETVSYSLNGSDWQTEKDFTITPETTQTYTLYIQSAEGCAASLENAATVTVNDAPTGLSLTSATVCKGQSTTLTAAPEGAASYRLNSEAWQAANTFEVSPTESKTYTLYVQSAAGCTAGLENAATVTVNAVPTVTASSPSRCGTGTVTLTASPGNQTTPATYTWKVGNAAETTTTTSTTYAPTVSVTGTTYSVTVTNNTGCTSAAATGTITLHTIPTVTASSPSRCGTGTVTLTASPNNQTTPATYTWKVGTAATVTTTGTTYAPNVTATGSTTYSVTVTNNTGCTSASKTGTITVHPAFSPGAITTASGNTTEGTNPNITIANSTAASGGDGVITYQWRRSGTSSATFSYDYSTYPINNSATNYSTTGTYYFTRYAHDGTCNTAWAASSGQYTLTVAISVPPNSSGTWSCGSQIWSGALRNPASCANTTSLSSATSPPAQYYDGGTSYGYYYNWTCVKEYGDNLCPSPWHVPTQSEFSTLVTCAGGDNETGRSTMLNAWGAQGFVSEKSVLGTDGGYYWSSSEDGNKAYRLLYSSNNMYVSSSSKYYGEPVRCVR
jgi:uncharacterized protein (TIGR02145 family)